MNREDITKLAREAGFVGMDGDHGALRRFAVLVIAEKEKQIIAANAPEIERINTYIKGLEEAVATEREACAKVCEAEANRAKWNWDNDISGNQPFWNGGEQLASSCAAAIRARGNT